MGLPILAAMTAFNLLCTGTQTDFTIGQALLPLSDHQKSFSEIYRVDLTQGRWCRGVCDHSLPIKQVSPTEIVFETGDIIPQVEDAEAFVNRQSGAYNRRHRTGGSSGDGTLVMLQDGFCKREAFTGLPVVQF